MPCMLAILLHSDGVLRSLKVSVRDVKDSFQSCIIFHHKQSLSLRRVTPHSKEMGKTNAAKRTGIQVEHHLKTLAQWKALPKEAHPEVARPSIY